MPYKPFALAFEITIVDMDVARFREILANLGRVAFQEEVEVKQGVPDRRLAREMLVFSQSDLAIPYQVQVLKSDASTWLKRDAVNSLVRSGTVEAASGLIDIIREAEEIRASHPESVKYEDIKPEVIDGIYRLHERGDSTMRNTTESVVRKYVRPKLATSID